MTMDPTVQMVGFLIVIVGAAGSAFFFIGRLSSRVANLEEDGKQVLGEIKELRRELHDALVSGGHVSCPVLTEPSRYGLRKASGETEI